MTGTDRLFRLLAALVFGGIAWVLALPWLWAWTDEGSPWRLVAGALLAAAVAMAVLVARQPAHVWGRGFLATALGLLALPFGVSRMVDRATGEAVRRAAADGVADGGPVLAFLGELVPGTLQVTAAAIFGIGLGLALLLAAWSLLRAPRP